MTKKKVQDPQVATVVTPERVVIDPGEETRAKEYAWALAERSRIDLFRKQLSAPLEATNAFGIRERLDEVVGPGGWSLSYAAAGEKTYVCTLRVVCVCGVGRVAAERDHVYREGTDPIEAFVHCAALFGIGSDSLRQAVKVEATPQSGVTTVVTPPQEKKVEVPPDGKAKKPDNIDKWDAVKRDWVNKLGACQTPDDLNQMLPGAKSIPDEFKKPLFEMIKDHAQVIGWAWDKDRGRFWDTNPSETIPF